MLRSTPPAPAWSTAVLLALGAAPAIAQTAPAASAPTSPPAGSFVFAAGTDASAWDRALGRGTPGLAVQAGYQRRLGPAGSRFAVRLAGDYWRAGGGTYTAPNELAPGGLYTFRRKTSIVGGSVLGVMDLRTRGAFRPYTLAGVGVSQYSGVNETAPLFDGGSTVVDRPGDRITAFAYSAGLGASLQVGRITPFAELRVVRLAGQQMDNSSVSSVRTPLTLGARFSF